MPKVSHCALTIFALFCLSSAADGAWRAAELWQDLPGTSTLRVFMFNVANPDEFLNSPKEIKPRLEEIGPYVYRVQHEKVEASQQFDDLSVRFRRRTWYNFDSVATGALSEMEKINLVNQQLLIYGTRIASMASYMDSMYIGWLTEREGEVMIRRNTTVKDALFNGMNSTVYVKYEEYIEGLNGQNSPPGFEAFEDGLYSYFKQASGRDFGELRMQTTPEANYGSILTLDRQSEQEYWNGSECNGIGGTSDGYTFPPSATGGPSMLFVYLPELCRAVMLNKDESEESGSVPDYEGTGIPAVRYILGDSFLNYSREHSCWCTDVGGNCLPDGALDIQSCKLGAPYAISQPGFRNADPSYAESLEWAGERIGGGDEPSYWIVEPKTGTVLESKRRFQLNIRVGALNKTTYFKNFPEFLLPILWMEETYKLDVQSLQALKSALDEDDQPNPEPTTTTTTSTSSTRTTQPPITSPPCTTTQSPTNPEPVMSSAQFYTLHDDLLRLSHQMLFSTMANVILLLAVLVMSFLALRLRVRMSSARPRKSQVRGTNDIEPVALSPAVIDTKE